jgi:hypothetical protein
MSNDKPKLSTYTVIGVYAEDQQRFGEICAGGDEDPAMALAQVRAGSPGLIIESLRRRDAD